MGDWAEDMFKYGMGMPGMGGMGAGGMGGMDMSGLAGMFGMMGESPFTLRKNHKLHHARRPSRLLKKAANKLRHPREFPFFAMQNTNQQGSGSQGGLNVPLFGMDSEELGQYLMMGGNRANIPPPVDGIDGEDLWMYRGTKWDPFAMFSKGASSQQADGTTTSTNNYNPWLYALLSGLQKRHMQKKY